MKEMRGLKALQILSVFIAVWLVIGGATILALSLRTKITIDFSMTAFGQYLLIVGLVFFAINIAAFILTIRIRAKLTRFESGTPGNPDISTE